MLLTRHFTESGVLWAVDGRYLQRAFSFTAFLGLPQALALKFLTSLISDIPAEGSLLAPLEPGQEVWASGVTYLRSRDARKEESSSGDIYEKVYRAERPELFFKSIGWRVVGNGGKIRVRKDSSWNVPEPELTLVVNANREIIGYCAGNDVSSRSVEGENPLYLPQAKIYNGSCALGPGIVICNPKQLRDMPIEIRIQRDKRPVFIGAIRTSKMNRTHEELVSFLFREIEFPEGVFLMTGTGIVPNEHFTLEMKDRVRISVGELTIENVVG